MGKSFNAWISRYENSRTEPFSTSKERLSSSKLQLEGLSWAEIKDTPIYGFEMDMTFGSAFSALRKTWYSYKKYKKDGVEDSDLALRIIRLQRALGLPEAEFSHLDPEWVNNELSQQETDDQLRREEVEDAFASQGLVTNEDDEEEETEDEAEDENLPW